jgi:hypothetical protein
MPDDVAPGQRPDVPAGGQPSSFPTEEQEIQAVNAREELLLRAKRIARSARQRVWRVMGGENAQGPHEHHPDAADQPESAEKQAPQGPPPANRPGA